MAAEANLSMCTVFCPSASLTFCFCDKKNLLHSSLNRPGAGKSTVSQAAVQLLGGGDGSKVCVGKLNDVEDFLYIYLDLDVCVPQWMRVSGAYLC